MWGRAPRPSAERSDATRTQSPKWRHVKLGTKVLSREAAKDCSPEPALSEVEGAQALGQKWNENRPRRGERYFYEHR